MDLDPRLLRYFIAVAEERHFSRAAARLHISQPPLSYAIRQLEDNVGARLLARTSRHVELTAAGQVLYREALTLLRQAEDVRMLVQRVDAGLRGRLRIGFVGSMLYRGLPALLASMRAELPDVEHVLTELNSHDQIEAVRRGEQDLGFIHANPVPAGVAARDLLAEPFVVCLPQSHPLAGRPSLALAELAADDFVFFARAASPSYYETVLSLCVGGGLHARDPPRGAPLAERGLAGVAGTGRVDRAVLPVAQRPGGHAFHWLRAPGALGQPGDLAGRGAFAVAGEGAGAGRAPVSRGLSGRPGSAARDQSGSRTKRLLSVPSPVSVTSTTSPSRRSGEWPSVPIQRMSPGCRVR